MIFCSIRVVYSDYSFIILNVNILFRLNLSKWRLLEKFNIY